MDILLRKSASMSIFKDTLKAFDNFKNKRQKCMKYFIYLFIFFDM